MEPPLESRAGPLGLIQPLPPVGRCSQAGRGGPQARPGNPSAPLILNRQPNREKLTIFGLRQILFRDCPMSRSVVTPCFRFPSPWPLWAVATLAPERFAHLRGLSLALLLSPLPVTGAGGAFLPRQGLGVFRHSRVSEKRSQTLNSGEKHYG